MRLVGRHAKEPCLELAIALKGLQAFDHRQECFLANLLYILRSEGRANLKDKAPGGAVMCVEEFIPCVCFAAQAACEQLGFGAHRGKVRRDWPFWRGAEPRAGAESGPHQRRPDVFSP